MALNSPQHPIMNTTDPALFSSPSKEKEMQLSSEKAPIDVHDSTGPRAVNIADQPSPPMNGHRASASAGSGSGVTNARRRNSGRPSGLSRATSQGSRISTSVKSPKNLAWTAESMGIIKAPTHKTTGISAANEPTTASSLRAIVRSSWLNVLLVFIPVSWALHFALDKEQHTNDVVIFVTCFFAIIPLAKLLAWGTEEIAFRVGQTLGGLLNATFGNVVELIVGVIALTQNKLSIVQSSLVGSILSNLLLVLGMCFFAGGTRFAEQGFMQTTAQLSTSLLILSVTAILIPAAFHVAIQNSNSAESGSQAKQDKEVLKMSRGVAFILLAIYCGYLIFQLWSHAHLYDEHGEYAASPSTKYPQSPPRDPADPRKRDKVRRAFTRHHDKQNIRESDEEGNDGTATNTAPANGGVANGEDSDRSTDLATEPEEEEGPVLTAKVAIILLIVVTVFVAVTAEFLVSSIDGLTESGAISKEWVGLILLPIVGNAAEHVTAVTVSVKDKLDLSIGVAVGSSIQIALFVVPFLVLLSWIMGKQLTLLFDPFESIVLFLSVLTVAFCINDGKSNWLEGMILMSLYVILAVAFWFYPDTCSTTTGSSC